ncbi:MAG: hypothetical protein ABIB71_04895 [Candidatus Woesearchaeota archaeon]
MICDKRIKTICKRLDDIIQKKLLDGPGNPLLIDQIEKMIKKYNGTSVFRAGRGQTMFGKCYKLKQDLFFSLGRAYAHNGDLDKSIEIYEEIYEPYEWPNTTPDDYEEELTKVYKVNLNDPQALYDFATAIISRGFFKFITFEEFFIPTENIDTKIFCLKRTLNIEPDNAKYKKMFYYSLGAGIQKQINGIPMRDWLNCKIK